MIEIIKVVESTSRGKNAKETVLKQVDFYSDAVKLVEKLNSENDNWRVRYKTGSHIYR